MKITARLNTGRRRNGHDELVIELPDLKLLRLIARSVLLAAAILSFPWLRFAFRSSSASAGAAAAAERKLWIDDPFSLPMLIHDLKRQGLFAPGATSLLLGDPSSRLPFLKKNRIDPVPPELGEATVEDWSVDFCLAADGLTDSTFGFVDRVLKVGGVAAVTLGTDPARFFRLPRNYRVAYIRRFGSTVVAIKKTSHAGTRVAIKKTSHAGTRGDRRLLSVGYGSWCIVGCGGGEEVESKGWFSSTWENVWMSCCSWSATTFDRGGGGAAYSFGGSDWRFMEG